MAIQAIVWDVDDTLFDYAGSNREALLGHLAAEGLLSRFPSPQAALERWQAVTDRQFDRYLAGELDWREQRRERARGMMDSPLDDAAADAWFGGYLAHYENAWRLFPDVLPALAALTADYRHAVFSNAAHLQQDRKLRVLGIRQHFETLLCADRVGFAKPAPEAFLAVCAALDLPPESVAYVGDQPETDTRAADAAGLRGIWLDRGGDAPPATTGLRRIASLTALPELLSRFAEPGRRAAAR